jgi:multidrug efflux pump subunit AcrA (membrane-fusion protein)
MRAQLAQSQSNYQLALAETAGDLAGAQARLSVASAQLAQSESQLQRVRNDHQRTEMLATQGVSARQDLDHITADLRTQQATVAAQSEQVRAAEADLMHAQAGEHRKRAAESAVQSAKAQLQNAESELMAAQARLDYTQVVAPISGIVSVLVARQGEVVGPTSPVVTIVDPQSTWVRVGIPGTYAATSRSVKSFRYNSLRESSSRVQYSAKASKAILPPNTTWNQLNRDIRSVAIKIAVPNPELTITPGMTAKVLLSPAQLNRKVIYPNKLASRQGI